MKFAAGVLALGLSCLGPAGAALAQTGSETRARLADLKVIQLQPGITIVPNAENDGREARIFSFWRDNGNAWGFGVYVVTMPPRYQTGSDEGADWWTVGFGAASYEMTDQPHTGEDAVRSLRFVRGKLDGKPATMLVAAERGLAASGVVPDPSDTVIRLFVLRGQSEYAIGMPDQFEPVTSFHAAKPYSSADEALKGELGLGPGGGPRQAG